MEKQDTSKHTARRLLALLTALALLLSTYLSLRVQVRFSGLNYVGQVAEYAARVTADNTGYLSQSTLDRAWTILRTTVRRPRTYDEYEMYASIAIAREDYAGAADYLKGCIDTYDGGDVRELAVLYLRLASLNVLTGSYDQALPLLDQAITLDPDLASAWFLRAEMHATVGETEQAVADLDVYKNLDGSDPVILSSLGTLYESTGDLESAVECYTVGIRTPQARTAELYASRGRCYVLMGDMASAKADLDTYFSLDGEDPDGEAAAMLASCRMVDGDYAGALKMFHQAVADGYATPFLIYSQSLLCAYLCGEYKVAVRDGERAITGAEAAGENTGELRYWVGLAHLVQGNYQQAEEYFTAARERDGSLKDLSYYLGVCALAREDAALAVQHFTDSLEKEEDVTACLYNRGICYLQLESPEEARADLTAVTERSDDPELVAQAKEILEAMDA